MNTISKELAKQISEMAKEKGVDTHESEWHWQLNERLSWMDDEQYVKYSITNSPESVACSGDIPLEYFPAYTTDELLDILPAEIKKDGEMLKLTINKNVGRSMSDGNAFYTVFYLKDENLYEGLFNSEIFCEALGELYLHLLSNDLIK